MRKKIATVAIATLAGAVLAPAAANASSTFTTPYWHMTCTTNIGGTFGNYTGTATCTGTGIWQTVVSCTAGGNPESGIVFNPWPGTSETATAGSCFWGVNSVAVKELVRLP